MEIYVVLTDRSYSEPSLHLVTTDKKKAIAAADNCANDPSAEGGILQTWKDDFIISTQHFAKCQCGKIIEDTKGDELMKTVNRKRHQALTDRTLRRE